MEDHAYKLTLQRVFGVLIDLVVKGTHFVCVIPEMRALTPGSFCVTDLPAGDEYHANMPSISSSVNVSWYAFTISGRTFYQAILGELGDFVEGVLPLGFLLRGGVYLNLFEHRADLANDQLD